MLLGLLKMNILLAVFALVYYAVLRRLTFYQLNRLYFLLAILWAVAYPFVDLSLWVNEEQQQVITELVPVITYELPGSPNAFLLQMVALLFAAGLVMMSIRLIGQFISLYRLHTRSISGTVHQVPVRLMKEQTGPFSFGKNIYINPELHTQEEQQTILAHEKIHVRQWHTFDILLTELMLLCCWFNPAAWLMSRAIRENLEFITDTAVLQKGFDRKRYQYSLLKVSAGSSAIVVSNKFTLTDIRKRIKMMNTERSSRFSLVSYSVFPVLVALLLVFSISVKGTEKLIQSFTNRIEWQSMPAGTDKGKDDIAAGNNTAANQNRVAASRRPVRRPAASAPKEPAATTFIDKQDAETTMNKPGFEKEKQSLPRPPVTNNFSLENDPVIVVKGVRIPGPKNTDGSTDAGTRNPTTDTEKNAPVQETVVIGYPSKRTQRP